MALFASSGASSNTRMNRKTLIIVISGVAASLIIAGGVGAYFVFGKDSKAPAVTTATTGAATATSGTEQTSLSQAASVTGTKVTQPVEPLYTAVPTPSEPFIPKGNELRPFYLQVVGKEGAKYLSLKDRSPLLLPEKTVFTHRPYGFVKGLESVPEVMKVSSFSMAQLTLSDEFNPKVQYSLAEPVPGSKSNEFYIKITSAGGLLGGGPGYICEKPAPGSQRKQYEICQDKNESLKFQAFFATPAETEYFATAQLKLMKNGVSLKNLHIPGYADKAKANEETWLLVDDSIRPASDPKLALTFDAKSGKISLKPAKYDGRNISEAQQFKFSSQKGSVSLKHLLDDGDKCEDFYLDVIDRKLGLVKDEVEFQVAEVQDISESVMNQIKNNTAKKRIVSSHLHPVAI